MMRTLRARLSPAAVIATIALFAALGGGYATAFSGSGTLQKGALLNIPNVGTTVRSLTGIGDIRARCELGDLSIGFKNTSGQQLDVAVIGLDGNIESTAVANGVTSDLDPIVNGTNNLSVHIYPEGGLKRPQAEVRISAVDPGDCNVNHVQVLALNTEE